ncbi:HAD-IA family hydrolase [Aliiglaciecola lipolytica]|uniref:HAD-IA family hydrolase n=1 Tax=Aliiglaciecola lipolytica TaxID=477689 RepID=UPI0003016362|nr:HAD-IA family hydrolase [Aliiglaciecola lipolytica]
MKKNKKITLATDFEQQYRARVAELFTTQLQAFPGVATMLAELPFTFCIASNGPIPKIRHALSVTGLSHFFADRLYSSFSVGAWKPDPALFLHAAQEMGFLPQHCVVIEDSLVGIQAAQAANMQSLRFLPNQPLNQQDKCFNHMSQLPALLNQLSASL